MLTLSVSLFIGILGKMGGRHCGLKNTNDAESSLKGCPVTGNGKSQPHQTCLSKRGLSAYMELAILSAVFLAIFY